VYDEILGIVILQKFLHLLPIVNVVIVATFPPNNVVGANPRVIEFNYEFEFEPLADVSARSINLVIWNFSNPLVTFCPLHLHATSASIFICFPFAEKIW